jgi:DNA polymerase-1
MATLLIVDGHAYAYRAFHAIPELLSPDGTRVNAIFGFVKMLGKLRSALEPAAVVVVWDGGLSEKRTREHPLYKANRPPMPESLGAQIEDIKCYLTAAGISSVCEVGVEADDYIGSLALKVVRPGWRVVIASSDKDFMQLVNSQVGLVNPGDKTQSIWGDAQVVQKSGVAPSQIVDWLSLVGDTVDNIPGVPGIGPKTAASLLQKHGSLEGVYDRLAGLESERLRTALTNHREAVFRNRNLIQLDSSLPVVSLDAMKSGASDVLQLERLYLRWGFRSLLAELGALRSEQPRLL